MKLTPRIGPLPITALAITFSLMVSGSPTAFAQSAATNTTVVTPFGPAPSQCVYNVGNNAQILGNGIILMENGTSFTFPTCPHKIAPQFNSWVEDAYNGIWPNDYSKFSSNWGTPYPPTSNDGQIIYLFIALLDVSGGDIAQPVLQWGYNGYFGGPYWTAASWYIVGNGVAYSTPISVSGADEIYGTMSLLGCGRGCAYTINAKDGRTGQSTTLNANTGGELPNAYVTLEAWNVVRCSDYPSGTFTEFFSITLTDANGHTVTPSWSNEMRNPHGCGEHVSDSPGSNWVALYY